MSEHDPKLLDRELSWLAFNRRSLYEVTDPQLPALERLLKLAQTSAALDEYFMVQVPRLQRARRSTNTGSGRQSLLMAIWASMRSLMTRQQAHFTFNLRPQLAKNGIQLLDYSALTDSQRRRLQHQFEDNVAPVLPPFITSPTVAVPDFSNLSLNLAVCLMAHDTLQLAWIKVPRSLPRFVVWPHPSHRSQWLTVPLEQVIQAHLPSLFPGIHIQGAYSFRVTRSADLGTLDTDATTDLMTIILDNLQQRQQQGIAVRLEVVQAMPQEISSQLMAHLQLADDDVYRVQGWLGLSDLKELARLPRLDLMDRPEPSTVPEPLIPQSRPSLLSFTTPDPKSEVDIFHVLQGQDLLVHLPYHSFTETVESFLMQAAADPAVLTIKMTLYRTTGDAPTMRSLMAAAKAGKQVVVLVELTAALDEAVNIHWAKSLEKAGAHVVYGVVGLKTHTNLVLVVRQEPDQIRQYAYISTGDYLPNRLQPYEDLGLLTSRPQIGVDLSHLFNFLTGCSRQVAYQALMVAPGNLRTRLQQVINREIHYAQQGQPAHLIAKLNQLADPDIIELLYEASQLGVEVDLIIRSVCRLRAGVPGLSDRIRVVSILGRYVEHSRVLYCHNGGQPEAWIGSADWTTRGLDEHIEVLVPITEPSLIADLGERLQYWLEDTQHAWLLQPDGRYIRRRPQPGHPSFSAQAQLTHHCMNSSQSLRRIVN